MAEPRGARLFVLAGSDLARSFVLGERTTLGRAGECEIVLNDRSVSRKHALLLHEGARWFVQDLGSTNGLTKGGQRGARFELADGDEFLLGDLLLRFKLLDSAEAQEIEFEPELGPAPAPRATEDEVDAEDEVDEVVIEGGVEIEDALELGEPDEPSPAAKALGATEIRARTPARRSGLLAGDLAQHPAWLQAAIVGALLVLGAGLAYAGFQVVRMLRAGN